MRSDLKSKPWFWVWVGFVFTNIVLGCAVLLFPQQLRGGITFGTIPVLILSVGVSFLGGIYAQVILRKIPKDTMGYFRAKMLSFIVLAAFVMQSVWFGSMWLALKWASANVSEWLITFFQVLDSIYLLPENIQTSLRVSNILWLGALVLEFVLVLSMWTLIKPKVKQVSLGIFDGLVLFGLIICLIMGFEKWSFVCSAIVLVRALIRAFPFAAARLENLNFQALVSIRHIQAPKSNFLTAIGAISILSVAFSSCSLTTTLSVMGGFRQDLKKKILGTKAHVVIAKDYGRFEAWSSVLEQSRNTEGVVAASPFVNGEVMVHSESNLAGATLKGIELLSATKITDLAKTLESGDLRIFQKPLNAPDKQITEKRIQKKMELPGVILGKELAKSLRVEVGDEVTLVSPNGELGPTGPVPKTRLFQVSAIYYSGMYEYDMKMAYSSLEVAQRFLRTMDGIDGIEIRATSIESAKEVAGLLNHQFSPSSKLKAKDWESMNQNLFAALALEKIAMFTILGIAILVAGFCVFGTLALLVQEKSREVGILKALGASEMHIVKIFVLEGFLIGLLGTTLGLGLGFISCYAAERFGIPMNPETYYIDTLPVFLDPFEFVGVGVLTLLICLLATFLPSKFAGKIHPLDAIRYE